MDPDEPLGIINTFSTLEEAIDFSLDKYGSEIDNFINAGMVQEEYRTYFNLKANNCIAITGPLNNSFVRVLKANFSDKNFSVSFGTLKGHVEAGSINFSGSEKDGKIIFDITGTTRISHGAGNALLSGDMRSNQKASWGEVLENVAKFLVGKTEQEKSTSVTYQYDRNKADGKGKTKEAEVEDLKKKNNQ